MIPISLKSVDSYILNPINSWNNKEKYIEEAKALSEKFKNNFKLYGSKVKYLINSGPII